MLLSFVPDSISPVLKREVQKNFQSIFLEDLGKTNSLNPELLKNEVRLKIVPTFWYSLKINDSIETLFPKGVEKEFFTFLKILSLPQTYLKFRIISCAILV